MRAAPWVFAWLVLCPAGWAQTTPARQAPFYTSASIVNAATNVPGPLAPNGLGSVYGRELATVTRAIGLDDLRGDTLPTTLIGTGVRVLIGSISVPVLFVSPGQINFLVPPNIRVGRHKLLVTHNAWSGPEVDLEVAESSPGAFQLDPQYLIATHADGRLIERETAAAPGQVIILYASGLGQTVPKLISLTIPRAPAQIEQLSEFQVTLNGVPMAARDILYAGLTPGFAGLYQINLRLPGDAPEDPELRLRIGERESPGRLRIFLRRP